MKTLVVFYGAICPPAMQYDLLTGHEIPVKTLVSSPVKTTWEK